MRLFGPKAGIDADSYRTVTNDSTDALLCRVVGPFLAKSFTLRYKSSHSLMQVQQYLNTVITSHLPIQPLDTIASAQAATYTDLSPSERSIRSAPRQHHSQRIQKPMQLTGKLQKISMPNYTPNSQTPMPHSINPGNQYQQPTAPAQAPPHPQSHHDVSYPQYKHPQPPSPPA